MSKIVNKRQTKNDYGSAVEGAIERSRYIREGRIVPYSVWSRFPTPIVKVDGRWVSLAG